VRQYKKDRGRNALFVLKGLKMVSGKIICLENYVSKMIGMNLRRICDIYCFLLI
jgi:hypothetical protein